MAIIEFNQVTIDTLKWFAAREKATILGATKKLKLPQSTVYHRIHKLHESGLLEIAGYKKIHSERGASRSYYFKISEMGKTYLLDK